MLPLHRVDHEIRKGRYRRPPNPPLPIIARAIAINGAKPLTWTKYARCPYCRRVEAHGIPELAAVPIEILLACRRCRALRSEGDADV